MNTNSESPCINICELDANDLCRGCYRTLDEIGEWIAYSDEQRRQVNDRCRQRKLKRAQVKAC